MRFESAERWFPGAGAPQVDIACIIMALDPSRKYLLGVLGRKSVNGDVGEVFEFNGDSYTLIFECKIKTLLGGTISRSIPCLPSLITFFSMYRCLPSE